MKGCSAVPVMGRVRHAATRDRDQRGHESVERPMVEEAKFCKSPKLGNWETKTGFFFCAAKKKGVVDRSLLLFNQPASGQRASSTANAHCLATTTATNVSCVAITR